eukprot:365086-Chlamydomonas_euryale.AAC.8
MLPCVRRRRALVPCLRLNAAHHLRRGNRVVVTRQWGRVGWVACLAGAGEGLLDGLRGRVGWVAWAAQGRDGRLGGLSGTRQGWSAGWPGRHKAGMVGWVAWVAVEELQHEHAYWHAAFVLRTGAWKALSGHAQTTVQPDCARHASNNTCRFCMVGKKRCRATL